TDPALHLLGALRDLEPGEHITAARFLGRRAYLSTMRFTDPLLTVDLADPAAPRLASALKVPGMAAYLHPMDADHLIAIGTGSQSGAGWLNNVQLQIYDVTAPEAPRNLHNTVLSADWSYSSALYDHKAFTYFTTTVGGAPLNVLAFPITVYNSASMCQSYGCYHDGVRVYAVSVDGGFRYLGDVYHDTFAGAQPAWWGLQGVQRTTIVGPDAAGATYVVTYSQLGVVITSLAAFSSVPPGATTPAAGTVSFPQP
ncbi:MAG TPA: beta-propeller domain-containing protein, partial [Myxococcota bacterium]|nr:beta-propeller domain-containing protein [Myxococcota bacterium]